MMHKDMYYHLMDMWANYRQNEYRHQTGWPTRSICQVMVDSGKLGALIPGTKHIDNTHINIDVQRVIEALLIAGLSDKQRHIINTEFNMSYRRLKQRKKAELINVSYSSYKCQLSEANNKIMRVL